MALAPNDAKSVDSLSHAYYRLLDYDSMIAQARRYTQLAPNDGDGWSSTGLAYHLKFDDAARAYEKSLMLLERAAVKAH